MFFLKSLTGNPLQWYATLKRSQASSWRNLSKAFLANFHFNLELQPRKADLEKMNPKANEIMNEYAYRWWQMVSNLRTLLDDEELIDAFIRTLGPVYQYMLLAQTHDYFATVSCATENVERMIREGIITDNLASTSKLPFKKSVSKDKVGEVQLIIPQASLPSMSFNSTAPSQQHQQWKQ